MCLIRRFTDDVGVKMMRDNYTIWIPCQMPLRIYLLDYPFNLRAMVLCGRLHCQVPQRGGGRLALSRLP
jgi:hypothetical protein